MYTMSKVKINKRRHILKSITWNSLAMTTTYFVLTELPPFFDLEPISKSGAGFLVVLDRIVKLIFYYFHERAWFTSNFGVKK
jgi:hypothetical protein